MFAIVTSHPTHCFAPFRPSLRYVYKRTHDALSCHAQRKPSWIQASPSLMESSPTTESKSNCKSPHVHTLTRFLVSQCHLSEGDKAGVRFNYACISSVSPQKTKDIYDGLRDILVGQESRKTILAISQMQQQSRYFNLQ